MNLRRSSRAPSGLIALALVVAGALAACKSETPDAAATTDAPPVATAAIPAQPTLDDHGAPKGLHNFKQWSDKLSQGGTPEGEEAFANLAALGVKTVVTVDGARPDIETAERYGLRYVHVPFGYDGVPKDEQVRIVAAVQNSDGPVYIHCHHGTARGPAATAVVRVALFGATNEEALKGLTDSGCAAAYKGLFRDVVACRPPTAEELAQVPAKLPSYVPPGDICVSMVGADTRFDRLKLSKAAKWKVPPAHPDVDPPHEATMLWEQFKEMQRLPDAQRHGAEFLALLAEGETKAKRLEEAIMRGDSSAADAAADSIKKSCDTCHSKFRNN